MGRWKDREARLRCRFPGSLGTTAIVVIAMIVFACGDNRPTADDPVSGSARASPAGTDRSSVFFRDATEEWGLDFVHSTGGEGHLLMPEIMGGGAAVFDADGDGRLDLYLVNGEWLPFSEEVAEVAGNRLYLQVDDGSFVDSTEGSGAGDDGYGMGCAVGDFDGDGDPDLYVTNLGPDVLLRNEGDGRFVDVTAASGLGDEGWGTSTTFFDYDGDGDLDLWVTRYVAFDPERVCRHEGGRPDYCGPTAFLGVDDLVYRNDGGVFVDASREAGITGVEDAGLGVVARDFDGDGRLDVYVANDADPNNLWMNLGDGTFVDEGVARGIAFNRYGAGEAGMGVTVADADIDGDLDVFVTHLIEETNTYYRNLGGAVFEDATATADLGLPSLDFTGFGTAFFDFDNDGLLDLGVVNGATKRRPDALADEGGPWTDYAEPNLLLPGSGTGAFRASGAGRVSGAGGDFTSHLGVSRALVPADLDADGDLDLLVTNLGERARLYRNEGGNAGNWVSVEVMDPELGREALGALLVVEVDGRLFVRSVAPVGSYLSAGSARQLVGLGAVSAVDRFVVRWLGGTWESFPGVGARASVVLERGTGEASKDPRPGAPS